MKIKTILMQTLNYFATLVLLIIASLSLVFNTFVTMDWHEIPIISYNRIWLIPLFVCFLGMLIIAQPILQKIPAQVFFAVFFLIFALMGLYLILNADTKLSLSDPFFCINAANEFNHGNYMAMEKGQYLGVYPYQLFWVSLLRIPLAMSTSVRLIYILNYIWVLLAFFLSYKITTLISKNNSSINTVVFLYFCFLPNLYHNLFVYNNIPAYTIFLLAIYFFIKSFNINKNKYLYYALTMFTAVIAYFIKNNFSIGIIALLIIYWLSSLNLKDKLVITLTGIICMLGISLSITTYYGSKAKLESGMPKIAFVVMGTQQSGEKYGRFNGYTVALLKQENYSTMASSQEAKKDLLKRIDYFKNHPQYTLNFFAKKVITTWTDPLFQSIWDGPLETNGAKYRTHIIASIYSSDGKGILARISTILSKITALTVVLVSIYGATKLRNGSLVNQNLMNYGNFALVFLIGGFAFHFFWETKSQYVWQYIDILLPFSGIMLANLSDNLRKLRKKYRKVEN